MKTFTTVPEKTIVREHQEFQSKTCDICGLVSEDEEEWDYEVIDGKPLYTPYVVRKTVVSMEEGSCYPEGGQTTESSVDICTGCFKTKLRPYLESLGAKFKDEEKDW